MSKFERFIRNNREKFDSQEPSSEVWNNIQNGLNNPGGANPGGNPGGGNPPLSGIKGFLSKIPGTWKAFIGAVIGLGTAAGLYVATTSGGQKTPVIQEPSLNTEVVFEMPAVNPPIEDVDVKFQTFKVNSSKGEVIRTKTGTEITIPEGAFVDADGKPVSGKVDIQYREFHDGADIIASGIPMKVKDGETVHDFQTAGMVEIKGSQGKEPVFIAKDKKIDIAMASFTDEEDHKLWKLDPKTGDWEDIGVATIQNNKEKEEGLRMIKNEKKPVAPLRPKKANEDEENTFDFAVDYNRFPELKPFKKIIWRPMDEKKMDENEWVYETIWTKAKLEAIDEDKGTYKMILSNSRKNKKFEFNVTPVLNGNDYQKALARFQKKKAKYDVLFAQREKEVERLQVQADLQRAFSIGEFGIYNCDRFARFPDLVDFKPTFQFPEDIAIDPAQTRIFHVTGGSRVVIPYQMQSKGRFQFSKGEDNCLVAVLPNNKVGIFTKADFKKMDYLRARSSQKFIFKMKTMDKEIKNVNDIRALINS